VSEGPERQILLQIGKHRLALDDFGSQAVCLLLWFLAFLLQIIHLLLILIPFLPKALQCGLGVSMEDFKVL
jgi:hypothetical protein